MIPNVVIVTWLDAAMTGHWQDGAAPDDDPDLMVHSVGWLARVSNDALTLVQSFTNDQHGNVIAIPWGMVLQVTPLHIPRGDS